VGAGVRLESHLRSNGSVDLLGGHFPFLHDSVSQNDCGPPVEKIQHSIVDTLAACPQLIYSVPKVVCLGTPKLVAQIFQSLEPCEALLLGLPRKVV